MGILTTNSTSLTNEEGSNGGGNTPTYLSGESLTFPLVGGVGTAALTILAAMLGRLPGIWEVVAVAIVCGIVVTIWGFVDSNLETQLTPGQIFKYSVIGLLNTVLLSSALWGAVSATSVVSSGSP